MDFHHELVQEAFELTQAGWTDQEIAAEFGVAIGSLYRWRQNHPEFEQALRRGKHMPDERISGTLFSLATGYNYTEQQAIKVKTGPDTEELRTIDVVRHQPANPTSVIFWLKNRRRDEWRDQQDVNLSGTVKTDADPRALAMAMLATLRAAVAAPEPVTIEGAKSDG